MIGCLTVRLLVSDYSQLPDYTFWLKLYRIIIEKNKQPMHQSHLSIFIVEPRFVEKFANAFPILFTPTKLLALLFWADAGHSFLCTGTQIQRSGVQFIAGFLDLIHVQCWWQYNEHLSLRLISMPWLVVW